MSALAVTLTVDQLKALMQEAVETANAKKPSPEAAILTREKVAQLLEVHPNVISRYVKKLGLPARRVGGEWRFLRSEVDEWLASQQRVPVQGDK